MLITASNYIPVCLHDPDVNAVVDLEINAASESHCKAGLIYVEVANSENKRQLWTVNIDLLRCDAEKGVREGPKGGPVRRIIFKLETSQKVLHRRVDGTASQWP